MPGMDGLDAVREIRRRATQQIPIIVLTAHAMEQDRQRCLEAGVSQHLTKPVDPDRLIQEIRCWVIATPAPEAQSPSPGAIDAEILHTLASELDTLLAKNSIAAEKQALRLIKELAGRGVDARLAELDEAIDRLDYPAARTILARLIPIAISG